MLTISDASPLIALSRINQLHLLKHLFGNVIVPKGVFYELTEKGQDKAGQEQIRNASWIKSQEVRDKDFVEKLMMEGLSEVDASVIALAVERKADIVIVDDKVVREAAKKEGLTITGTIGIIIQAKKLGLIESVKEALDDLKQNGFWIKKKRYQEALREAKEAEEIREETP